MNKESILEKQLYYPYSSWLKNKYGEKVYKLPINLPVGCPNKTAVHNGCTFCSEQGTGFESVGSDYDIITQIIQLKDKIRTRYHANKFIAYFQNYTNTYMPVERFENYLKQITSIEDIVEVSISTRPDCINDAYLQLFDRFMKQYNIHINIELGLQTANIHTLKSINRGHGLAEYIDAMNRIKQYPFTVCTHIIANLPGDDLTDMEETSKIISVLGTDIVKIHSLYIAKDSAMAESYLNGDLSLSDKETYFRHVACILSYLAPNIAVERLFSRIPEEDAYFCNWQTSWWKLKDELEDYLMINGIYQGLNYHYRNGSALKNI